MTSVTQLDSIRLVNCAGCRRELLGDSMPERVEVDGYRLTPRVAGRLAGRPYCGKCLGTPDRPGEDATS